MRRFVALACSVGLGLMAAVAPAASQMRSVGIQSPPPYSLEVTFQGLIAFVPTGDGVWALLVNADYNPRPKPDPADVPLCAAPTSGATPNDYPRHVAALRFHGAKATLNGGPLGDVVPALLLKGRDLRFATGKRGPATVALDQAADGKIMAKALSAGGLEGLPGDFTAFDVVDSRYLNPDSNTAMKEHWLGARVLVDFGDSITAAPLNCATIAQYGFTPTDDGSCFGTTPLAETVTVAQTQVMQPVTITLGPDKLVLSPARPGGKVSVEILNVMPEVIVDPYLDACHHKAEHLKAFQWFYRLLQSPPSSCPQNYFPCLRSTDFGGDACPLRHMVPAPSPPSRPRGHGW
jgi:hypothetical protein